MSSPKISSNGYQHVRTLVNKEACRSLMGPRARKMVSQAPSNYIPINGLWKKRQAQKHNAMGGCWEWRADKHAVIIRIKPDQSYFSPPPSLPPAGIHRRCKQNPNIHSFASRVYPVTQGLLQGKPDRNLRKWILRIKYQMAKFIPILFVSDQHPGPCLP